MNPILVWYVKVNNVENAKFEALTLNSIAHLQQLVNSSSFAASLFEIVGKKFVAISDRYNYINDEQVISCVDEHCQEIIHGDFVLFRVDENNQIISLTTDDCSLLKNRYLTLVRRGCSFETHKALVVEQDFWDIDIMNNIADFLGDYV